MNWAACNLADRKEFQGAVQNRRLLWAEERGTRKLTAGKNVGWLLQDYFPLRKRIYQADDLY